MSVNQFNHGFAIFGGDGVTIADVEVRDVFGDFLSQCASGCLDHNALGGEVPRHVRVVRLDGTRAARQCVAPTSADGFWLEDSTLRDCWYGGVDLELDVPGATIRDVHILRNRFDGYNLFAIAIPAPGNTGDVDGVEIRGNTTTTAGDTCMPTVVIGYHPATPSRMLRVVVEENHLRSLAVGVSFDHVQGGSVRNNRIEKSAMDSLCGPPAPVPVALASSEAVVGGNVTVGYSGGL